MSLYWVAHSDLTKAFDKVHILCSLREEWLVPINVSWNQNKYSDYVIKQNIQYF